MYSFISRMYVEGRIDAAKVQTYVGYYITQKQADTIIAMPRKVSE